MAPTPFTVLSIRVLPLYLQFFFVFLLHYPIIHSLCLLYSFFHRVNISIAILRVPFFLKFSASSCACLCSLFLDIDLFFLASLSHISNLLLSISISIKGYIH